MMAKLIICIVKNMFLEKLQGSVSECEGEKIDKARLRKAIIDYEWVAYDCQLIEWLVVWNWHFMLILTWHTSKTKIDLSFQKSSGKILFQSNHPKAHSIRQICLFRSDIFSNFHSEKYMKSHQENSKESHK